jgi:membrane associated rhomboid family serine protease
VADSVQVVRITAERRQADDWALVLNAVGFEAQIDWHPQRGYLLLVDTADLTEARAALAAFDLESQARPEVPEVPGYGKTHAPLAVAALLCAAFVLTGPRVDQHPAFANGAAHAAAIWSGEWWRAATALTLHADFPHLLGNTIALIVFGTALCGLVGPGVGLAILALAGVGGNLLTSVARGSAYSAVGASTAIFGGLGALAALQVMRRRRAITHTRWRTWTPLAAAIALLGILGGAAQSDVLAHLFGFGVGGALGALAARFAPQPLGHRAQRAVLVVLVALFALCWFVALSGP